MKKILYIATGMLATSLLIAGCGNSASIKDKTGTDADGYEMIGMVSDSYIPEEIDWIDYDTEEYDHQKENTFLSTATSPFSTLVK